MNEKIKITAQPNYQFWCPHLLKALHNLGGTAKFKEISQKILSFFDIDDAVRDETTPKSQDNTLINEIHGARHELKGAQYIYNSVWGVLALTEKAKKEIPGILEDLENLEKGLDKNNAEEYINKVIQYWQSKKQHGGDEKDKLFDEEGLSEKRQSRNVQEELNIIKGMDPYGFERLCARIFEKLKYKDVEVTQKSRDGGLDGFGYLEFGLVRFKVVFQAKRYTNAPISGSEISGLLETMRGSIRAEKGVFITTSKFSSDAIKRADELGKLGSMITLINGEDLIQLLREYKIGYYDNKINQDFFNKI